MRWAAIAFLVYLVLLGVSAISALLIDRVVRTVSPGASPQEVFSSLAGLIAFGIVSLILGIVVLVFFFVGFGYLYGGRNEYGPAHARNVRLALFLLIAAIVVGVAGFALQIVITFMAISFDPFGGAPPQFNPGLFYAGVTVGIVMGIVVAALVAALLVLSIRALARSEHHVYLYAAAGVGTATPGIVGALTLLQLPRIVALIQDFFEQVGSGSFVGQFPVDPASGLPTLVGSALGIVTFIVYLFVYRDVAGRIGSGDLKPVLPTTPASGWMPPVPPQGRGPEGP